MDQGGILVGRRITCKQVTRHDGSSGERRGWIEAVEAGDRGGPALAAVGRWVIATARELSADLETVRLEQGRAMRLDLGRLEAVDTVGALLLLRFQAKLNAAGSPLELTGASPAHAALIEAVRRADRRCDHTVKDTRHPIVAMVRRTGAATFQAGREALDLLNFLGMMVTALARTVASPRRLRGIALVHHIEQTGLNALPIVGLLSFLIGVVLAYQGRTSFASSARSCSWSTCSASRSCGRSAS